MRLRVRDSPLADALVLAVITIAFFANAIGGAHAKPFWHDEIFTILVAQLPSVGEMWRAARDGVDLMPPLNGVLTHFVRTVAGDGPIVTRLPPMAGVWLMCVAVFAVVRRRSNTAVALAAALLPVYTAAYRYAIEARGYGLMLGCFGVAVYAWSEAALGRRRAVWLPLLSVSLGAGAWAHHFGALNLAPIVAGELVRDLRRRKPDWGVWTAVGGALAIMLPLMALVSVALGQAGHFWTRADPAGVGDTYLFLVRDLLTAPLLVGAGLVIAVGRLERRILAQASTAIRIPAHEIVAIMVCLLLPILGVAMNNAGLGVFAPRYALSAVLGVCAGVPLFIWIASGRSRLAAAVLAVWLLTAVTQPAWASWRAWGAPPDPLARRPLLVKALARGERVCVTGGLMYLQFWYYAPPESRSRLCYLADPAAARRLVGTDSFDVGFMALRRWTAVTVHDYDAFVDAHRAFTVYGAGSGWLLARLAESGATVQQTDAELGARMYRVTLDNRH